MGTKIEYEFVAPGDIEKRSMEIIGGELAKRGITLDPVNDPVIRRAIHTSADFDYAETLTFSENAVEKMRAAIRRGARIVTDTEMARSGVNKKKLAAFGGEALCFIADAEVAREASERGVTRATVSMERAAALPGETIFAIGNAPTALIRLREMIDDGLVHPAGIIGVPVGFVNVVEAKEMILDTEVPFIVARGRKGGSNIAAAICNALMYGI